MEFWREEITQLIQESRAPDNETVKKMLLELQGAIRAIAPSEITSTSNPFPALPVTSPRTCLSFVPPSTFKLIGSFRLGTTVQTNFNVDLAMEMPRTCFHGKDFLHGRYFAKRILFLRTIAAQIGSLFPQSHTLQVEYLHGCPYRPILVFVPHAGTSGAPQPVLRLFPTLPAQLFQPGKLAPSRCNFRAVDALRSECTQFDLGSTEAAQALATAAGAAMGAAEPAEEEEAAEGAGYFPTPNYSNWIAADTCPITHRALLHAHMQAFPAAKDAAVLFRIWARQRGLLQHSDAVSGYHFSMLLAYLSQPRPNLHLAAVPQAAPGQPAPPQPQPLVRLRAQMDALQTFRAALAYIANGPMLTEGLAFDHATITQPGSVFGSTAQEGSLMPTEDAAPPSLDSWRAHFGVCLVDPVHGCNVTGSCSRGAWAELQVHARGALDVITRAQRSSCSRTHPAPKFCIQCARATALSADASTTPSPPLQMLVSQALGPPPKKPAAAEGQEDGAEDSEQQQQPAADGDEDEDPALKKIRPAPRPNANAQAERLAAEQRAILIAAARSPIMRLFMTAPLSPECGAEAAARQNVAAPRAAPPTPKGKKSKKPRASPDAPAAPAPPVHPLPCAERYDLTIHLGCTPLPRRPPAVTSAAGLPRSLFLADAAKPSSDPVAALQGRMLVDGPARLRAAEGLQRVLERALGERALAVRVLADPGVACRVALDQDPPAALSSHGSGSCPLWVCLLLDVHAEGRLVERGPPADQADAVADFRAFWGPKAETRRFKDGTILESVVWEPECGLVPPPPPSHPADGNLRRRIPEFVVRYALTRFFEVADRTPALAPAPCPFVNAPTVAEVGEENRTGIWATPMWAVHAQWDSVLAAPFTTPALMMAYDQLANDLRGLAGLPLRILELQPVSPAMRFTDPFPPRPHPLLGAPADAAFPEEPRNLALEPLHVLLRVRSRTRPPRGLVVDCSSPAAIAMLKCSFAMRLAERIEAVHKATTTCHVTRDGCVDITRGGFLYRVSLYDPFELRVLQGHAALPDSALAVGAEAEAANEGEEDQQSKQTVREQRWQAFLEARDQWVDEPAHHRSIEALQRAFPTFRPACRLVKRWVHAQMLQPHITDRCVELLVGSLFTDPRYLPVPTSAPAALYRFFHLVSTHNFASPLLVDFESAEDIQAASQGPVNPMNAPLLGHSGALADVLNNHRAWLDRVKAGEAPALPSPSLELAEAASTPFQSCMFLASRYDHSGARWNGLRIVDPAVFRRFVGCCKQAADVWKALANGPTQFETPADWMVLFHPTLAARSAFHGLLLLCPQLLPASRNTLRPHHQLVAGLADALEGRVSQAVLDALHAQADSHAPANPHALPAALRHLFKSSPFKNLHPVVGLLAGKAPVPADAKSDDQPEAGSSRKDKTAGARPSPLGLMRVDLDPIRLLVRDLERYLGHRALFFYDPEGTVVGMVWRPDFTKALKAATEGPAAATTPLEALRAALGRIGAGLLEDVLVVP
ncbi:putative nucleolar RNA-associated family protein [Paratrimastix pyriformis]|uniref:Nucleolar RNA-associated family protein n=1 Tax=Paratrimastix pyriformis TaxID=342808 RepID=A0ABQ8U1U5_9EUKA|nr:putative nucleolar RNA-associated family protein [Paratrimastix pyriformis]